MAGIAACLAVLARPQAVGALHGALLDVGLIALCCLAIRHQARLVLPAGARPDTAVMALPAAALISLAVAVGGTDSWLAVGMAIVAAAAVVGVVPHLDALRIAGRATLRVRLGLDLAGIVVAIPLALLGASDSIAAPPRALLVLAGCALLGYDGLRQADPLGRPALAGGLLAGAAAAAMTPLAAESATQAAGATALLFVWYGTRGCAGALDPGSRSRSALVEYGAFVIAGVAYLAGAR